MPLPHFGYSLYFKVGIKTENLSNEEKLFFFDNATLYSNDYSKQIIINRSIKMNNILSKIIDFDFVAYLDNIVHYYKNINIIKIEKNLKIYIDFGYDVQKRYDINEYKLIEKKELRIEKFKNIF